MSAISSSTASPSPSCVITASPTSSPSSSASDFLRRALEGSIERIKKVAERLAWRIPSKKGHFNDPVIFTPMQEPSILNCGHTFDELTIRGIMARTVTCSLCRAPITTRVISYVLKAEIEEDQKRGPVPTFTHFREADRELADTYLRIARGFIGKGKYEEALDNYRMAFLYTDSLEDYLEVPVFYETNFKLRKEEIALAYLYLACYQLKEGRVPEAIESLEKAKKSSLYPLNIDALLVEWQLSIDSSQERLTTVMALAAAIAEQDPEEAIAIYRQVIALDRFQFDAYTALGSLLKNPAEKKALLLEAARQAEEKGKPELAMQFREEAEKKPPLLTAFSKEMWTNPAAFKDQLPPYPPELEAFLAGDCTIWPGKRRSETHIVVPLCPTIIVDGLPVPRTLASLDQLDKASGGTGYRYIWDGIPQDTAAEAEFHWAVLTRDILPRSRNKSYAAQVGLIPTGYEVPDVLSAATAILWEKQLTGTRRFNDNPWTYTRCKEAIQGYQLVVGGFAPGGLYVADYFDVDGVVNFGVAGLRKF